MDDKPRKSELANPYFAVKMAGFGIRQWQVAEMLGVSESVLSKRLSKPLGFEAQREMVERIEAAMAAREGGGARCAIGANG